MRQPGGRQREAQAAGQEAAKTVVNSDVVLRMRQRLIAAAAPIAESRQVVRDKDAARVGVGDDDALRPTDRRDAHDQSVADSSAARGIEQLEPERSKASDLFENRAAHASTPLTTSKVRWRIRSASGMRLSESICTMRTM